MKTNKKWAGVLLAFVLVVAIGSVFAGTAFAVTKPSFAKGKQAFMSELTEEQLEELKNFYKEKMPEFKEYMKELKESGASPEEIKEKMMEAKEQMKKELEELGIEVDKLPMMKRKFRHKKFGKGFESQLTEEQIEELKAFMEEKKQEIKDKMTEMGIDTEQLPLMMGRHKGFKGYKGMKANCPCFKE